MSTPSNKNIVRILMVLVAVIVGYFLYKYVYASGYFTFKSIKENTEVIRSYYLKNKIIFTLIFFLIYTISVSLAVPGVLLIFSVIAGFIFKFYLAVTFSSIATSIGTLITFLYIRFLFYDISYKKFQKQFDSINKAVHKNLSLYLMIFRLFPIMPFALVNSLMALTKMSTLRYYLITQVFIVPEVSLYVFAGSKIEEIQDVHELISPEMLIIFAGIILIIILGNFFYKKLNKN